MASYSVGISVSVAALPRHPSHSGNDVLHSLVVGFGWRRRPGCVGPVLTELHHVDEELSGPVVAGESPVGPSCFIIASALLIALRLPPKGNRISKLCQQDGEICVIPAGALEFSAQGPL
ncbi:MAG: hypothetical protein WBG11_10255 [Methylocella sp.]